MLNREKEGLLTDMYEGLEYQVLEDLCNEWEFDNDVSVGKFVEQRIDRPFPSEEEACKMLDVRVFLRLDGQGLRVGQIRGVYQVIQRQGGLRGDFDQMQRGTVR